MSLQARDRQDQCFIVCPSPKSNLQWIGSEVFQAMRSFHADQILGSRRIVMWELPDFQLTIRPFHRPYPVRVGDYFRFARHPELGPL